MTQMKTIRQSFGFMKVCEEHFEHGPWPCAHPECRNGIAEDEFQPESLIAEQTTDEVYRRVRWEAPNGFPYYSWVSNRMPALTQVENVVGREALVRGFRVRQQGGLIYHYTSLVGLKGILDSQEVWLTDYGYLNDSKELDHGLQLFETRINEARGNGGNADLAAVFSTWATKLRDHQHRICISSYSKDGDSLSQWRAYGSVAIGFEPSYVLAGGGSGSCQFDSVIYNHADQERLADFFLNHVVQAFRHDVANANQWPHVDFVEMYGRAYYWMIGLAAQFKNEGFSDEREIRVAYIENPALFEDLPLEPIRKRFRATSNAIIPYVTTKDLARGDNATNLPVREIVVGPSVSDVGAKGIREYLDFLGLDDVVVKRSKIPFRSN